MYEVVVPMHFLLIMCVMYVWCVQEEEEEIAAAIPTMDKRFRVT